MSNGVVLGTGALSGGTASLAAINLPAGSNQLQAVYNGDSTNGLSASTSQTVNVAAALTPVMVSVGGPSTTGQGYSAIFSALVIPNFGPAVPTGTVSFSVDGGSGTAVTLGSTGQASYSNNSLPLGPHTITAAYAGDANYSVATGSISVTVILAPGLTLSGTAVSLTAGATTGNTSTITVTPTNGFTGSVSLSAMIASGPTGAANPPILSFGSTNPVSITSANAATATLTVLTTGTNSASLAHPAVRGAGGLGAGGAALACLMLFGLAGARRRGRSLLGMVLLAAMLVAGVASCGGGGGTSGIPATTSGTYTATVTSTSGIVTAQTTVKITVQ